MGLWDFISWSKDSVKGLCQSSYDHGSAAITKVNKVVTVDAVEKVNQHWSDPETRLKITRVATDVAKNATIEGLKTIPGAYPTYKLVSKSLSDDKNSRNKNKYKEREENLKTLQATVSRLEKEVAVLREQAAVKKQAAEMKPHNTVQVYEKPEDKSQVFLMKEFICSVLSRGKKLYETFLQEKFKDQPTRLNLEDVKLMEEEKQLAKMEDMNEVKLQSKTAAGKAVGGLQPQKQNVPQGIKEMAPQDPNRKRTFIRSRL